MPTTITVKTDWGSVTDEVQTQSDIAVVALGSLKDNARPQLKTMEISIEDGKHSEMFAAAQEIVIAVMAMSYTVTSKPRYQGENPVGFEITVESPDGDWTTLQNVVVVEAT